MITNERQYKITKAQMEKLRKAIDNFNVSKALRAGHSKTLAKAQLEALKSEFEVLAEQVQEYESLKSGSVTRFSCSSLSGLPILLIKARIAKGFSQRDLADRLGLKEQQIQRYESDLYSSASLKRLSQVADALGISVSEITELEAQPASECREERDFTAGDMFPIDEMYRRGWFEGFTGSLAAARANSQVLLRGFFHDDIRETSRILLRQRVRIGGSFNAYALRAWQYRVITLAKRNLPPVKFDRQSTDENWFSGLAAMSSREDGPGLVSEYLRNSGVAFVVESRLKHTHLDGTACLLSNGTPVVALTVRYDRLDNFWFVLFHELVHVVRHLRKGKLESILDNLDFEGDEMEQEADQVASNTLIPDSVWETAIARYVRSKESVIEFARQMGISPAIVAGRIRMEAKNYTILTELVGQGEVRKHFSDVSFT